MTAAALLDHLRTRGETLATAESLTAGLIASTIADVPGASDVLCGGVATYATPTKTSILGVPAELIESEGAVSAACAEAMATGARALFGATWAVSATGVAGPDTQDGLPVGTVFVAVAGPTSLGSRRLALAGGRAAIRAGAVHAALIMLTEAISSTPDA